MSSQARYRELRNYTQQYATQRETTAANTGSPAVNLYLNYDH